MIARREGSPHGRMSRTGFVVVSVHVDLGLRPSPAMLRTFALLTAHGSSMTSHHAWRDDHRKNNTVVMTSQ
jgi:hypothetical protein